MKKKFLWLIGITIVISTLFVIFLYNENRKDELMDENEEVNKDSVIDEKGNVEEYDVVVIGGEPEGVAAAVSAARNGAKTLLIEKRDALGGLFTYGMLNYLDIPQGPNGDSVSKGIYEEWHQLIGGGNAFGIQEAKDAFKKLISGESNLTLLTETDVLGAIKTGNRVIGIQISNQDGEFEVYGKAFIDATQDADFAVMSGAPYFVGGEDIGVEDKKMSVTLMMHFKNVNWDKVRETAESEKFGSAVVTNQVAWGFPGILHQYDAKEENTRVRGLNIAKVNDEIFINALQIFGVNGLDEQSKKEAIERGKRETEHFLSFLQAEFPGFENAVVASFPSELYVRETRHIKAEYQLPMSDVWTNRDHWDSIAIGAYPVDIQAQTPQDYGHVVAHPEQYAIPFRSIVPLEIDGLLVVGRSAGYSSLAAGSARIVPTGMAVGEAAGVAASFAVDEDILFREMIKKEELINKVRSALEEQNAYVEHFELDYPYQGEWFDEAIQTLMNYGLVFGGYNNDLKVEDAATTHHFANILNGAIRRVNQSVADSKGEKLESIYSELKSAENRPIKRDEAAEIIVKIFFDEASGDYWQMLIENGVIDGETADKLKVNRELKNKELFAIGAAVIEYVRGMD